MGTTTEGGTPRVRPGAGGNRLGCLARGKKGHFVDKKSFFGKKGKADKNIQEKISWERPTCQKREELWPSSLKSPMLLLALCGGDGAAWGEPPQSPPALQSPRWHRSLVAAPSLLCKRGTHGWDCLLLAVSRAAPQTPLPGTQRRGISRGSPKWPLSHRMSRCSSQQRRAGR